MDTSANSSQFIIYVSEDGQTKLDVRFMDETVWLTQALMAALFGTTPENVLMHLKNIYAEGELDQNSTTKDFLVVRQEGTRQVQRTLKHYNLDALNANKSPDYEFKKTIGICATYFGKNERGSGEDQTAHR